MDDFSSNVIQPLLTDFYQVTMAYCYWRDGKQNDSCIFELFFRKNPFNGEFTIFAGLSDCLKLVRNFKFSEKDIEFIKNSMHESTEPEFFDYLKTIDASCLDIYAVPEGSVVFPRIPLITVEGPVPVVQLLETTLLNLVNFASLVTTNAARYRNAVREGTRLYELGLRRAQGPDGGLSASKYAYIGGFDATSNVLAGKYYGIPLIGSVAHSFVMSYNSVNDIRIKHLKCLKSNQEVDFLAKCTEIRKKIIAISNSETNDGEFASFVVMAIAMPLRFIGLIDTYSTIQSGVLNYCAVAIALNDLGYKPIGVRIDSGDLAYLSNKVYSTFERIGNLLKQEWLKNLLIITSNELNEDIIISLNEQTNRINCYGVGTHLVTCHKQPALGCVYKLIELNGEPRMKLSDDLGKLSFPGSKRIFRLFGSDDKAICDLLTKKEEPEPKTNERILCRHPLVESKRAFVTPSRVKELQIHYWSKGKLLSHVNTLEETKKFIENEMSTLRVDIKRYLNPTPYKVSVSADLYDDLHRTWLEKTPILELS